jgi:aminopeptidase 2
VVKPSGRRSEKVSLRIPPPQHTRIDPDSTSHGPIVYDKPPTASAKIDALMSLGATQKPELIEKTFTMLHDGSIKDQDVMYGFVSLSSNRLATRKVAAYFKDNYKTVSRSRWLIEVVILLMLGES